MTRRAPVLVLRQPVMTPVPLLGMAPYAAAPTPISTATAMAETAANLCFFDWNNEALLFLCPAIHSIHREVATTLSIGLSRGGRGGGRSRVPLCGPMLAGAARRGPFRGPGRLADGGTVAPRPPP